MKRILFVIVALHGILLASMAQTFQKVMQGVTTVAQGLNIEVKFYSPSIVRVYKTPILPLLENV